MKQTPMTRRGMKKLKEELDYLKNITRPEIIKNITEARRHGDLKENAEYQAAREQQGFCEGRIREIEFKLATAHVIDIHELTLNGKVVFGSTVNIENVDTKHKFTYRIVGDDEANLKEQMISVNSPIARGLISHVKGDVVVINTPNGSVQYRIISVEYPLE